MKDACTKREDDTDSEHWFATRQSIFQTCVTEWNRLSPEVKHIFADRAKSLNEFANQTISLELQRRHEEGLEQTLRDKERSKYQTTLVDLANQHDLIFSKDVAPSAPSLLEPKRLATHAVSCNNMSPSCDITNGNKVQLSTLNPDDSSMVSPHQQPLSLTDNQAEKINQLADCAPGFCGLGDNKNVISETMLDYAAEQTGVVQRSHLSFQAEHGTVCERLQAGSMFDAIRNDQGNDQLGKSCQMICGRYCRKDISNASAYANAVEMLKSIDGAQAPGQGTIQVFGSNT